MVAKKESVRAEVKVSRHPVASIIIRAKNEEALVGEVLTAVYEQTFRDFEVILVDSGSTDRTLEIARTFPVKIIEIRPEEFTYGRALNIGCGAAQGKFLVFVSAHAIPLSLEWLAYLLSHFSDPNVAGVWGACTERKTPVRIEERVVRQDLAMFLSKHTFGFSNVNAAVRADIWRPHAFHELLPYGEDKEWAYRVLQTGYAMVYDTRALVWHYHGDTLRQIWRRSHLEHVAYTHFLELPLVSRREVLRRVCQQAFRQSWNGGTWRQRIGPLTAALPGLIAREIGRYTGLREAKASVRLSAKNLSPSIAVGQKIDK
jgi:glycosyltransferase involved in cell wall biosynthesis